MKENACKKRARACKIKSEKARERAKNKRDEDTERGIVRETHTTNIFRNTLNQNK